MVPSARSVAVSLSNESNPRLFSTTTAEIRLEALFNDPNVACPAVNRAGATGTDKVVQVFARRPDQVLDSGAAPVQPETTILDGQWPGWRPETRGGKTAICLAVTEF